MADFQAQLAARKQRLNATTTEEKRAEASTVRDLVAEWALESGLVSEAALLKARDKFFDTSLDLIVEVLPEDAIIPSASRALSEAEVKSLVGFWGNGAASSSIIFADIASFVDRQIAEYAKQYAKEGVDKVFVKLGSRSAKDVTWTHEKTLRLYHEAAAKAGGVKSLPMHRRLELLYRAQIDCLAVTSFSEALSFFMDSTRVLFDLQLSLKVPSDLRMSVVVRPWFKIPLCAEWRAFMNGGKLRGLSQYFTDLYFDGIENEKENIRERILAFYENTVKARFVDKMGLTQCVIDFLADPAGGPVRVLEVNQWADSTGSGFFDWQKDRKLLEDGDLCPIRVRERPIDKNELKVPEEWRKLLIE